MVGKALGAFFEYFDKDKVGVAVSGGGDSVALLCLLSEALKGADTKVFVYSVDHGLRPEAGDEVGFVAKLTERLGYQHRALTWCWNGQGNVSAAARQGRYNAISLAAKQDGVGVVLLGHTKDDQAETVLMALARRAGVNGLAGMQAVKEDRGISWARPLLDVTRADLREYLAGIGQGWVEDPTNDNAAYERVRMRKAAVALADLGISAGALCDVAANMQDTRVALEDAVSRAMKEGWVVRHGAVRLDRAAFSIWGQEIQRRVMAKCLTFVAPLASAARRGALLDALLGQDCSLAGCLVLYKADHIWVVREPNAVTQTETPLVDIWDGKWRVNGPSSDSDLVIRALGEAGLKACKNWRDIGVPRPVLLSSPSIWRNDRLIAAPIVGYGGEWSAEMLLGAEDFLS